jgi:hypothetical protein
MGKGKSKDVARLQELMDERDRRYSEVASAQARAVDAAFASAKEAVLKAEAANAARFESVNEFRGQLNDQAANFVTRTETEQRMEAMRAQLQLQVDGNAAQIAAVMRNQSEGAGRRGGAENTRAFIFAIVAALTAIVGVVIAVIVATH